MRLHTVHAALALRLADAPECWLHVRCATCPASGTIPLRLLAARAPPGATVADVLPRLRCQRCRGVPGEVVLAETPYPPDTAAQRGHDPGWRVVLAGEAH